ncbi:suppressor of glycerol defect protein, putative, partial [Rhizoctonia solani AG-3 Rhs1AP]
MAQTEADMLEEISRLSGAIDRHKSQQRGGYRGGRPHVPSSYRKPYADPTQQVVLGGQVFQSGRGGKSLSSTPASRSGSTTPQYVHAGKNKLIAANRVNKKPPPPPPAVLAAKRARLAKHAKILNNVQAHRKPPFAHALYPATAPTPHSPVHSATTLPPNACPSASTFKTRADVDSGPRAPIPTCFSATRRKQACVGILPSWVIVRGGSSVSEIMCGCKLPHVIRASRGKMEAAKVAALVKPEEVAQPEGQPQKLGDEFVSLMFEESEDEDEEEDVQADEDEAEEDQDLNVVLSDVDDDDDLEIDKRTKLPQSLLDEIGSKDGELVSGHVRRVGGRRGTDRKAARKEKREAVKRTKGDYFTRARDKVDTRPAERVRVEEAKVAPKTSKPKPTLDKPTPTPESKPTTTTQLKPKPTLKPKSTPTPTPLSRPTKKRTRDAEDDEIAWLEAKLGVSKKKKKKGYGGAFSADGLDDILGDLDRIEEDMGGLGSGDELGGQESEVEDGEEDQDEKGQVVPQGAYVPPHLRPKADSSSTQTPEQVKLARQTKGLLNRLTEQNIEGIVGEVEALYRSHPRNDVTRALTSIILDSVSSSANLLDTFVILHAAFVAAIHKIIGIEFAAYFIEHTVSSYEKHWSQNSHEPGVGSKESSNLLVLVSELYNFQVISCVLIYDLVRALLNSEFSEFDVELLLKVLKNSGQQMRQDDPLALKDIIQLVQDKMKGKRDNELSSRFRFMVETLVNLKNNKMKRATGTGQNVAADAIERMKKYLGGINKKRHVMSHEPLRVSLEDLHSSSKRGKWWLVGSAWGGNPLVENQNAKAATRSQTKEKVTSAAQVTEQLMQLARQHGMNTEVRRNVFVVLVSSDDYVDACERLTQLDLQETQQREIIRVVLHCCGNERAYNPFYTLVAHHLCQKSHSHRITLQYCLWDFLRSLGETQVGGEAISREDSANSDEISDSTIQNYAKAYAWWLARGSVSLTIFKPVEFLILQPRTKQFFNALFAQIIVSSQSNSPLVDIRSSESVIPQTRNKEEIEEIAAKARRLPAMCKGIGYFIQTILSDEEGLEAKTKRAHELVVWGLGVLSDALQQDSLSDDDL